MLVVINLKTIDSSHIQASGEYETNSLVDRFNRIYTTAPSSLIWSTI